MTRRDGFEDRLDALKRAAAATGKVAAAGTRPEGAPFPIASAANGYYGLPLLKKPVWTWEIPAYFFAGGTAGAAALLAELSRVCAAGAHVVRSDGTAAALDIRGREMSRPIPARVERGSRLTLDARWIAALGGAVSAPLLIADLGRPDRFLYMLRVFKPQSAMSVGAWIVLTFSNAAAAALAGELLERRFARSRAPRLLKNASGQAAAVLGLGMATYTGVLIGATAVPVWSRNVRLLPVHFAFSALGTATSILQLRGHTDPALHRLGLIAATVETAIGAGLEGAPGRANEPLKHGRSGWLMRASGVLSGPVPLLLRALGRGSPRMERAAAVCTIAGSLLTRYGWIAAGRASATDPRESLGLPAHAQRTAPGAVLPPAISRTQAPLTVTSGSER